MLRNHILFKVGILLLIFLVSACRSEPEPEAAVISETAEFAFPKFDAENFDSSTNIDNEWLPYRPGKRWVFEGFTIDNDETVPHRIVFTVTDLTKEINGVRTVVAWIEDYADEELIEAEIAFYAQDNDGNVWYFGEYPEEYEDGQLVDAPTWLAGIEGATAGIKMPAEPRLNTPSFAQGLASAVGWTDRGQVYKMGQSTCVPFDCFGDVMVMDEFNEEEPGAIQLKYYARDIGQIRVGWRGDDPQQEELVLIEYSQLGNEDLIQARDAALALEARAYENSEDVFGQTTLSEAPALTLTAESDISNLYEEFNPNNFNNSSTLINNPWLPLQPGTKWIYEGFAIEDGEIIPHRIEFSVSDLTKEIFGVLTVVAWIEDFSNGELVEAEIAFYAQDLDGTVWFFGEYPEEYEGGAFVNAPTWIPGVEGSLPGIQMPANPQPGTMSYSQGWAPSVSWTDRGQVYKMGQRTCVPFDCFENVLIMDEFNREEPGAIQLKFYAPEVGQVRVAFRGEDLQGEILDLVDLIQLDDQEMAALHEIVLAFEERAYVVSPNVYGTTNPMK